ncbi:hypothetical protein D3C81_1877340 [compost metagenome]
MAIQQHDRYPDAEVDRDIPERSLLHAGQQHPVYFPLTDDFRTWLLSVHPQDEQVIACLFAELVHSFGQHAVIELLP